MDKSVETRRDFLKAAGLGLGAPGALDEPLPPEWERFDLEKGPERDE